MENPDPRSAVSRLVEILRKTTRLVQIAPFVYLAIYAIYLLTECFLPAELALALDDTILITPSVTLATLILGRLLRLCYWHKAACLIPYASKVEGYIDSFVITFTQEEIILINTAIGILSLAFIILAVRHFTYGRKANTL